MSISGYPDFNRPYYCYYYYLYILIKIGRRKYEIQF